jgi:DNA-binding NarL/FixJ family response regulator
MHPHKWSGGLKILIVDDHPLMRDAMGGLLRQLDPAVAIIEAGDCAAGLATAREHADINLVLLDLNLPGSRGFDALDAFRRVQPTLPVVILSMHRDRETVLEAIRRGAAGYVPKTSAKEVIVIAARLVLAGGVYLPAEAVAGDASALDPLDFAPPARTVRSLAEMGLTPRQGQVLALLMRGQSNKEICRSLGLAERTVKIHVTAVLTALRVASRTQAVIAAGKLGLSAESLLATNPAGADGE